MFADYVYEKSAAKYANKILLIDVDHLTEDTRFTDGFKTRGFEIVVYKDDLSFRIEYEEKIKYKVPAGTQPGTIFRIKGKGIVSARGGRKGSDGRIGVVSGRWISKIRNTA